MSPGALLEPSWLAARRREAEARFRSRGLPTTDQEEWRHTSLAALSRASLAPIPAASPVAVGELEPFRIEGADELVFVDGHFSPELSIRRSPEGATVAPLSENWGNAPALLGSVAPAEDAFVSLNTASFRDGARVELAADRVLETPVHLLFYSTAGDGGSAFPRVLVDAARASQVLVVETHAGRAGGARLSAPVTEIRVGPGATVEHVKLQLEAPGAYHVGLLHARQERDGVLRSHLFSFGGGLVRNEIHTRLAEPGAEAELNGLFFADGDRHVDNATVIDHAAVHGTSRELYKGVLAGRARGVFHGRIVVRPGAQKTDAVQTNRNLLLSDGALVHSIPGLEILADDVKCKHGSTIGQLDDAAIFYLRSRGISEEGARRLLARAFAGEVVARLRDGAVRRAVESRVAAIPELSA